MNALSGAGIVVTRPAGRGEALCERIRALGGDALHLPAIDIAPLPAPALPAATPDHVIFASVPAVEHGLALVRPRVAATTRVAAIGAATAGALRGAGVTVHDLPEREESEGLLELPAFHAVDGKTVWLVRGLGGRELLPDALRARGANLAVLEVYERRVPGAGADALLQRWRAGRVQAIVVTSRAGLENLCTMLDAQGRAHLKETQLVVPTERMLKLALEFDIRPAPIVAAGASDDALLEALVSWWQKVD